MINEEFSKLISKALDNTLSYKGACIKYNGEYIDLDKCEVYIKGNNLDDNMVVYVVTKMFKEGKIDFTEKAFNIDNGRMSDVDYLKKLLKIGD